MTRAGDHGQRTVATGGQAAGIDGVSHGGLLPYAWPLFTAVWLLFPVGFVVRALRADLPAGELLAFLASVAAFLALFLLLMLRYPFPGAGSTPREIRVRTTLLLALAALALYVELAYGGGVPYRFMYVVVATAAVFPTREAAWTVATVTACAGAVYWSRSGWDATQTSWQDIVPFPLVGIGMIALSRLVFTVRELQTARREIGQLAAAEAVAEERLRFARDLHDLLGHSLSLIALKSTLAGRLLPAAPETERAAKEVRDVEVVARGALREVREAVTGYRRTTLDEELAGAREMLEAAGIECRIENGAGALPSAAEAVLAWAVREGATNVIRHSRARFCEIRLTRCEEGVRAEVNDDGSGPSGEAGAGTGLSGLSERVASSGGDFRAGPSPAGGFRLYVSLPLRSGTTPAVEPASGARGTPGERSR